MALKEHCEFLFKLEQVFLLKIIKSKCSRLNDFAHCLAVQHCKFVFVAPNPIPRRVHADADAWCEVLEPVALFRSEERESVGVESVKRLEVSGVGGQLEEQAADVEVRGVSIKRVCWSGPGLHCCPCPLERTQCWWCLCCCALGLEIGTRPKAEPRGPSSFQKVGWWGQQCLSLER